MYKIPRGGKNILFSGTATKSGKIFCELSTQILYNLNKLKGHLQRGLIRFKNY
jgi:hypothetical protein